MPLPTVASVPAATALEADRGQIVDLRGSSDYRKAHVPGARWSIRPRLGRLALDPTQPVYLIGAPDAVALAAKDLRSQEHTSELMSIMRIQYDVFYLKTNNEHTSQPK